MPGSEASRRKDRHHHSKRLVDGQYIWLHLLVSRYAYMLKIDQKENDEVVTDASSQNNRTDTDVLHTIGR
jgi:hypothetical protein